MLNNITQEKLSDAKVFGSENAFDFGKANAIGGMLVHPDVVEYYKKFRMENSLAKVAAVAMENRGIDLQLEFECDEKKFYVLFKNFLTDELVYRSGYAKQPLFPFPSDPIPAAKLWILWLQRGDFTVPALSFPMRIVGAQSL